jgi:ABC-type transport system substrate-binding protein/streptogramin lyase
MWLLNLTPASFVELDPATGKNLTTPFKAPDGVGKARAVRPFAVGPGALWVTAGHDLVKMDPRLGIKVRRFYLDKLTNTKGQAQGVTLGDGLVWVGRDVKDGFGQVVALDPGTGRVRYQFPVPHHVDLAFDDGIVWASDSGGVDVIDPATKHVANVDDLESMDPFFGPNSTGNGVAAGGGFGWTTDPAKGVVYKIDRAGHIAERYSTGLGATGVSYSDGAVWVRNEDVGTVTRIDPVTGRETSFGFGHSISAEVAGGGVLLAALEPGPTIEDRFDALPKNSLRLFSKQGVLGLGNEPALDWDSAAHQIYRATCANLLRHPDAPPPEGLKLVPEVAAGMPRVSRDRRTYTFTIRRGYRFSPPVSEPLTAQTFRYSIERAASPHLESDPRNAPGIGAVYDVEGFTAFRNGKAQHLSGLRVHGDQLSITLTEPSADFLERLTSSASCPVPLGTPFVAKGGANRSVGANEHTIPSAGPYYVARWRNDKYAILKRNPFYHGPRPHKLDEIALREGVDVGVALDRIRHRGWDGIVSSGHTTSQFTDPRLDPGNPIAKQYGNTSSSQVQWVPVTLPHATYIDLNGVSGPLADPTVRRAVAFAVNRTAIAPIWDATPTDQLLPPVVGGFRDRDLYPLHPDLAKARARMHGRRLKAVMVLDRPDAGLLQEALLLRAELRKIGIRVVFKHLQGNAEIHALNTGHPRIDLADAGITSGSPDGASLLESVFVTTGSVPRRWLTPRVMRKVEKVNSLSGYERQAAAGALADQLLARDVPLVAIGNRAQGELFAPTVGCRVFPPTDRGVDLAGLCRRP